MNAQQEAVALWKFLEGRGLRPSVRSIGRALRDHGLKFREDTLRKWLAPFAVASRTQPAKKRDAQNEHAGRNNDDNGTQAGRDFARADKVSLISNSDPTDRRTPRKRARMKQAAFQLGPASAPEIDYDKPSLSMPDGLPDEFPDQNDELLTIAETFCRAFGGCKSEKALRKHRAGYNTTLAGFRQRGIRVADAWQAFVDAVVSQEGRPLFGFQAKQAGAYLRGTRRPLKPIGPRVDTCGCPLPSHIVMPRLKPGETAHWDGDEFIFGSDCDPK